MSDGIKYDGSTKKIVISTNDQESMTISGSTIGITGTLLINGSTVIPGGGGGSATLQSAYDAGSTISLGANQLYIGGSNTIALEPSVFQVAAKDALYLGANDALSADIRIGTGPTATRQILIGGNKAPITLGNTSNSKMNFDVSNIGYIFNPSLDFPVTNALAVAFLSDGTITTANSKTTEQLANVVGITVEDAVIGESFNTQRVATMHGSIVLLRLVSAPNAPGETVYLDENPGFGTVVKPVSGTSEIKLGILADASTVIDGDKYYIIFHPEVRTFISSV